VAHWLQRLETAWSRRNVRGAAALPADRGRTPVCVVTGASEGLGRHLANEFAARGMALLLVARNEAALQKAAAEIRATFSVAVYTASIDLTLPSPERALRAALESHRAYADILVNNAGAGLGGLFATQDEQRIAALCRLNIDALTSLTRAFLPDMLQRGQGGILNIASIGGLFPGPYQAAYYASKAYVISLSEALAFENAGRGLRISAAAPGPIATRFHEKMGTKNAFYLRLQHAMTPQRAAKLIASGFMGRKTVIVPGLLPSFNAFAVRLIPHAILVPFIGWLLKKRY
jgi:short-subunit dehydrogenase